MAAVLQKRQTRLTPKLGESQIGFVERGNKALYQRIPDATKRSRYLLKCWREAGRDGELTRIASDRFPDAEFQTVHDSPVFVEHSTVGSDGRRRVYDRKALAQIAKSCNDRILDTGDFAVLAAGHTPDDPTSANHRTPETLGYVGPFRLGIIGNKKPRWAIFADEHHRRDDLDKIDRLPRRSAEVWLEDNILDPIAALGAETPRLDTGIIRNSRLPSGRIVTKYSAAASASVPCGINTSPQSFNTKRRENYAAGDDSMQTGMDDTAAVNGMGDEQIQAIISGVANLLMQSKPMQFLISQMPPDWSPDDAQDDQVANEDPEAGIPGDEMPGENVGAQSELDEDGGVPGGEEISPTPEGGDEIPPDVGATTAEETPDEENASNDELESMDDEDKERYAAHDSAGRRGFLQAWRKHGRKNKSLYSAGAGASKMAKQANDREFYSRLAEDNAAMKKRIDQMEAKHRHDQRKGILERYSRTHVVNVAQELEEMKDVPQEQFDRHCRRIKESYSRLPVGPSGFSEKFPVDRPEIIGNEDDATKKSEKYSRRAKEIADAAIKAGPSHYLTWDAAMEQARKEIDGQPIAAAM